MYTSFSNDLIVENDINNIDDLRTSFLNKTQNVNEISYNRLFQENKDSFFANKVKDNELIYKLMKKPARKYPFINQYKLIPLPNKNTTTLSNCTNPNTKIKLAISPVNKLVAIKQFKKGDDCKATNQTASHNNVPLKVLNNYMEFHDKKSDSQIRVTPSQAHMRSQFDKLAWEYYIHLRITQSEQYKNGKAPNIIEFYGVIDSKESNKVWFVFEYCQLGELVWESGYFVEFLNKIWNKCYGFSNTPTFFANFVAIRFLKDCLNGLKFLNDIGIAHRDIKPSNILIQKNFHNGFTFKISDFETAIVSVDENFPDIKNLSKSELYKKYQNEANKLIGSPMFIAPEICGFVVADFDEEFSKKELKIENTCNITLLNPMKLDCWALGVSLYCVLKGQKPFKMGTGGSEFDLYRRINTDDIMDTFKSKGDGQSLYDLSYLRSELINDNSTDIQIEKIIELSSFTMLELCDQFLVKTNSKRKLASEILVTYGAYLTFIEDSLSQLANKSATNGDVALSNDNMLSLSKRGPLKLASDSSLKSNSSYSNSGESLHIITSPSNLNTGVRSTSGKFKKLFQRSSSSSKGNKSPAKWLSKTPEKQDISSPMAQRYLSMESSEPSLIRNSGSSSNKGLLASPLNRGKYIDLTNFSNSNDEYDTDIGINNNSSSNDNVNSDDGFISITSSDNSSNFSDSDNFVNEHMKLDENMKNGEGNNNTSTKTPTPYNYNQLDFGYEGLKNNFSNNIKVPKRSPMRQLSVEKKEQEEEQDKTNNHESQISTQKRTLTPSMKTIDFKKFLNDDSQEKEKSFANKKKNKRLTVLNIRDSILNFENIDALKKYLSFAENGEA
ncbi:kinase-like protein [Hanseniaspora valbyensis NRRL Y-1626]|uniref:Kinase-like protein n=1 Tax=Hanseniaspora valbyensis NRRL Y-1626 TaxID=766949 RepID=A0A1B7TJ86_9ASCO|nr:kinase-like protein [Hanseniaspora valbyensis NRRL Y-1626]